MDGDKQDRDPLSPLAFIVNVLSTLFLVLIAVVILAIPSGHAAFGTLNSSSVCSDASVSELDPSWVFTTTGIRWPSLTRDRLQLTPEQVTVCDTSPSLGLRLVADGSELAQILFVAVFLILCQLLLRKARRVGLFTPEVARKVSSLGYVVLLGSVITWLISALMDGATLHMLLHNSSWGWSLSFTSLSVGTLIAGFGIITIGRVMTIAVAMQHDIDATI